MDKKKRWREGPEAEEEGKKRPTACPVLDLTKANS